MREKRTFTIIFALLAIFLAVLPFLVTFNEALTHLVEKFRLYMWVQERIVLLEVKMVRVLIVLFLAYSRPLFAVVYHDYLAAVVTILWLLAFWWFSYSFVLEEKKAV